MRRASGVAAVVRDDAHTSEKATPAHVRSVELTTELAKARVAAVLAMRELQRITVAGGNLHSLADAAEAASLAAARFAGFARMLAATLPHLT